MKQTSIEWLFEKLWEHQKDKLTWHSILNKAKEMHNQEIIQAHGNKKTKTRSVGNYEEIYTGEKYYQETFSMSEIPTNLNDSEKPNLLEISDNEIEKFADEELGTIRTDFDFGVIQGMKWYREQLKQRQ
jgi:hypothetical protein